MPVTITTSPVSQKCLIGARLTLSVACTGSGPFTYQWRKDGVNLDGQTSATLLLASVDIPDAGVYSVRITGADYSHADSNSATIVVDGSVGLVPRLTGNTGNASGHIISASSDGPSGAWHAFEYEIDSTMPGAVTMYTDSWVLAYGVSTGWIQIQFPTPTVVRRYRIYPGRTAVYSYLSPSPKDWTLLGSDDGRTWVTIDVRSGITGWTVGQYKEFVVLTNNTAYAYYRLNVTLWQGDPLHPSNYSISEIVLFEDDVQVAISAPVAGSRVKVGQTVTVSATVTAQHYLQPVQSVKFYANNQYIGQSLSLPASVSWQPSATGSYNILAVVTNSLGERFASEPISVAVDPAAVNLPPLVSLVAPVAGAHYVAPAVVSVSFWSAGQQGKSIDHVSIYANGSVLLAVIPAASGTYVWHNVQEATYAVKVVATDSVGLTSTSSIAEIIVDPAPAEPGPQVPIMGSVATLTALTDAGAELPGSAAFVWRFWDFSSAVTTQGAVQKLLNRDYASFTVAECGSVGQVSVKACYGYPVKSTPIIERAFNTASQRVLPYYVTLSAIAYQPETLPLFTWLDASGQTLSVSVPAVDKGRHEYTHKVTSVNEKLYLRVSDSHNHSVDITVDFTLPGIENVAPVISTFDAGLRPRAWESMLAPVSCATTVPLGLLAGLPVIDGFQLPAAWVKTVNGTYATSGVSCRVLVKNQVSTTENGIYEVRSTELEFTYGTGADFVEGTVQFDVDSGILRVSNVDGNADDVTAVLADHLVAGRFVVLDDGTNTVAYSVDNLVEFDDGLAVSVSALTASGDIADSAGITLSFSWVKTTESLGTATTVPVVKWPNLANVNGGGYFSVVADPTPDYVATVSHRSFARCDAGTVYGFSAQSRARAIFEMGVRELNQLNCTVTAGLPNFPLYQICSGQDQSVVRAVVPTDGLSIGSYDITAQVANMSSVDDFQAEVSTTKAAIDIVAEIPLPDRPYSTEALAKIAQTQASLSNAPGTIATATRSVTEDITPVTGVAQNLAANASKVLASISSYSKVYGFSANGTVSGLFELKIGGTTVYQVVTTVSDPNAVILLELPLAGRSPVELVVTNTDSTTGNFFGTISAVL